MIWWLLVKQDLPRVKHGSCEQLAVCFLSGGVTVHFCVCFENSFEKRKVLCFLRGFSECSDLGDQMHNHCITKYYRTSRRPTKNLNRWLMLNSLSHCEMLMLFQLGCVTVDMNLTDETHADAYVGVICNFEWLLWWWLFDIGFVALVAVVYPIMSVM